LHVRMTGPHERLPRLQLVLPAVPRAGDQARLLVEPGRARGVGDRPRGQAAQAQRAALVRAAVADRVEALADAEHPDRARARLDDAPLAVAEVAQRADDDPHQAATR